MIWKYLFFFPFSVGMKWSTRMKPWFVKGLIPFSAVVCPMCSYFAKPSILQCVVPPVSRLSDQNSLSALSRFWAQYSDSHRCAYMAMVWAETDSMSSMIICIGGGPFKMTELISGFAFFFGSCFPFVQDTSVIFRISVSCSWSADLSTIRLCRGFPPLTAGSWSSCISLQASFYRGIKFQTLPCASSFSAVDLPWFGLWLDSSCIRFSQFGRW